MLIRAKLTFILLIGFMANLLSQTQLTGKLLDEDKKPIHSINVLVYPHDRDVLIAFGITNSEGRFNIRVNNSNDSLKIKVTSLQYRNDSITIANRSQEVNFELLPEVKDLEEFVVRASPIIKRGDTISYLVASFVSEQDRSISDVLKRMPGIEVESSGRILYQGRPIQHFYVEGLDLMGRRYGMISENLPHEAVSTVEVLENHQPIKILEDRMPSFESSMNIKLKSNVSYTGRAQLGAGVTPILWDANITPMLFTSDFQVAGSYQANNTGNDASRQLRALTIDDLRQIMDSGVESPKMLNITEISPPDFKQSRYLDNNIHMANANALQRLGNDLQLRTNVHYIYDLQQQNASSFRTLYTPTDTITFNETIENRLKNSYLKGEITLNRNVKENYLRNELEFKTHWDKQSGDYSMPDILIEQKLDNPFYDFSNKLTLIQPVGKKLLRFNSYLQYDQTPQQLKVSPGQFEELINSNEQYDYTQQNINLQRLNTDHSFSFSSGIYRWSVNPELGFQYNQRWFDSKLFIHTDNITGEAGEQFNNSLDGLRTRAYLNTNVVYKKDNFTLTSNLPLSYLNITIEDINKEKEQNISKFIFDPQLYAKYEFRGFWQIMGVYSFGNRFGNMEDVYYGYIFKNHRTIHLNDAPLSQSRNHNISTSIRYRNAIRSLFASAGYNYNIQNTNLLYSNLILDNGATILDAIESDDTSYSHNAHARINKYFRPIRSTITLGGTYSRNQRKQFVNDEIFNATNNVYLLLPQLHVRITEWLNSEYKGNFIFYDTYHGEKKLNSVSMLKHYLNLYLFHASNQFIAIKGEYYQYGNDDNYFFDLQYRYTITDHRIDIDARWINIFNQSSYRDYHVEAFSLLENYYVLRPSQFVLSVRFNF